jgi:hypothetical protein
VEHAVQNFAANATMSQTSRQQTNQLTAAELSLKQQWKYAATARNFRMFSY